MVVAVASEIAIRSRSSMARGRYIETTEQATRGLSLENQGAVLEQSVAWLELFYLSALTWEYIHEHKINSIEQLQAQATEVEQHVRCAFPDLGAAEQQMRNVLGERNAQDELLHADWKILERGWTNPALHTAPATRTTHCALSFDVTIRITTRSCASLANSIAVDTFV